MAKKGQKFSVNENMDKLKREFMEGVVIDGKRTYETLAQLTKRNGLSYSTVSKAAMYGRWKEERDRLVNKKEQLLDEKYIEREVKAASEFDDRVYAIARRGLAIVEKHFNEAEAAAATKGGKLMAVGRLESLSKSADKFQRIAKLALGQPTDNPAHSNPDGSPITFTFDIAGGKKIDES